MSIEFTCEATRESLIYTKTALIIFLTKYSRLSPAHKITLKTHFSAPLDNKPLIFIFIFSSACLWRANGNEKNIFRVSEWKAGHKQFFSRYGVLCSLMFNTWATIRCENIFFRQQNMSRRLGRAIEWKIIGKLHQPALGSQIKFPPHRHQRMIKRNWIYLLLLMEFRLSPSQKINIFTHSDSLTRKLSIFHFASIGDLNFILLLRSTPTLDGFSYKIISLFSILITFLNNLVCG